MKDKDNDWYEFEKTGSIFSYLKYKGALNADETSVIKEDGEIIGSD